MQKIETHDESKRHDSFVLFARLVTASTGVCARLRGSVSVLLATQDPAAKLPAPPTPGALAVPSPAPAKMMPFVIQVMSSLVHNCILICVMATLIKFSLEINNLLSLRV